MNNMGYYGLIQGMRVHGKNGTECRYCGGTGRSCYRYPYQRTGKWVYLVMTCHACKMPDWEIERSGRIGLQWSTQWVDMIEEDQIKRLDAEIAHMMAERARRSAAFTEALQPEQPPEPPESSPADEVNDEAQDEV